MTPLSNTSVLGRALRWPLRFLPTGRDVRILTGPLAGARWVVGRGNHGYWLGRYEPEIQALFSRHVRRGTTVLDVGANYGFYSLLAARLVGSSGQVLAFEPMPKTMSALQQHLELNPVLRPTIRVFEMAVGNHDGEATLGYAHDTSSASIHPTDPPTATFRVPIVRLDTLYADGRIPKGVSFVKIDVEGAEVDVLSGGRQLIAIERPVLVVGCHSGPLHARVADYFRATGYSIAAADGTAPNLTVPGDLLAWPSG